MLRSPGGTYWKFLDNLMIQCENLWSWCCSGPDLLAGFLVPPQQCLGISREAPSDAQEPWDNGIQTRVSHMQGMYHKPCNIFLGILIFEMVISSEVFYRTFLYIHIDNSVHMHMHSTKLFFDSVIQVTLDTKADRCLVESQTLGKKERNLNQQLTIYLSSRINTV